MVLRVSAILGYALKCNYNLSYAMRQTLHAAATAVTAAAVATKKIRERLRISSRTGGSERR